LHFSTLGTGRFDALGGEFGIVYLASDEHCAFIEAFGRELDFRLVTRNGLELRALARIEMRRPLLLVDLAGEGLAQLGADGRLCTGDYLIAQRWSHALWQHPNKPDGLLWRSRFDLSRMCVGVYDRAADALEATSLGSLIAPKQAQLLEVILRTYRFGVIDSR
jgi:hypothetical protein